MNRRALLMAGLAAGLVPPLSTGPASARSAAQAAAPMRTRWTVKACEGLDAVALLGPLTGKPLYASRYESELAAIRPRLGEAALAAVARLDAAADRDSALLWPGLALILSGGPTDTLDAVLEALEDPETVLRPPFEASVYWDEADWTRFLAGRADLVTALTAMRGADFSGWLKTLTAADAGRVDSLAARFATLDIIAEQERLLGRPLDPEIEVDLLWFCKPHGVRVQGQRFIGHYTYDDAVMVKVAAHEILHPPFPMDGPTAKACLAALAGDPLFARILAEKDKGTGYNDLEGILNEDVCQALDQIIQERLGIVQAAPDARWTKADQGMHVLAAGLYGWFKADGYDRTGGNLEDWMSAAAASGRLSPEQLHPMAAAVLNKPVDQLWTTPTAKS